MRAVVDHHVDRPGVEAQQCVKLTGTNCSIGLIPDHPPQPTLFLRKLYRPLAYMRVYGTCKTVRDGYSDHRSLHCLWHYRHNKRIRHASGALSSSPKDDRGLPGTETRAQAASIASGSANKETLEARSSSPKGDSVLQEQRSSGIDGLVVIARADPPDPIPNSAVKSLSAHGTAS